MKSARDTPEVIVEIRAAEIAADATDGAGLGGHRPDHNDGDHCWHFYSDELDLACCYCNRNYDHTAAGWCRVAHLAREIMGHKS